MKRKGNTGETINEINVETGEIRVLTIVSGNVIKYGFYQYHCVDSKGNNVDVLHVAIDSETGCTRVYGNGKRENFLYTSNW